MIDVVREYLQFIGIDGTVPETVGEFLVWFVMICVCVAIIRFILDSFFKLTWMLICSMNSSVKKG